VGFKETNGNPYVPLRKVPPIQRYFCKGYDFGEKKVLARPNGILKETVGNRAFFRDN